MENVVYKRPFKTNALGNRNGCLDLVRPKDNWKSIRKMFEEVRNSYKEITEGFKVVTTSLCEESKSLSTLENLSEGIIRKKRVVLNEKENSKGIKAWARMDLKKVGNAMSLDMKMVLLVKLLVQKSKVRVKGISIQAALRFLDRKKCLRSKTLLVATFRLNDMWRQIFSRV